MAALEIGDRVKILDGAFQNYEGVVTLITKWWYFILIDGVRLNRFYGISGASLEALYDFDYDLAVHALGEDYFA